MRSIEINNQLFNVEVIYKKGNKKSYIRFKNNILVITSPLKLTDTDIKNMISNNYQSVIKLMQNIDKVEDKIHFLGNNFDLKIIKASNDSIYIKENVFIVETKKLDSKYVSKLIALFYKNSLEKIVGIYFDNIKNKFGLNEYINVEYKKVKGYYGQCRPKEKKIILNLRLVKYDVKYIISVIYHELAHFRYLNHQKKFYDYLEEKYPNYRQVQKELRKIKYNDFY